ncbi:hypothetical protein Ancab_023277 [Ancistrocladus abbreviatus]
MALRATKMVRILYQFPGSFLWISSIHSGSLSRPLEESIKSAVSNKSYQRIADILDLSKELCHNPNPFSFLSMMSSNCRTQIVVEILRTFLSLRPRSRAKVAYDCLLSYALQSSTPFPLALAVIQCTLRSGCIPLSQTYLLLSSAWLGHRDQPQYVSSLLLEMKSIGYRPDCGTCNYVVSSLCAVDQLDGAIEVLRGMTRASCIPDVESYGIIIAAMCRLRQTPNAMLLLKEMVGKFRLSPVQGVLFKLASSLCANKETWKGFELIEFLEGKGLHVGFETYELIIEGCLECREFVLAGKVAVRMTQKGFIPYIKIRQKVIDGLAGVGEWQLACAVRHRFAELNS